MIDAHQSHILITRPEEESGDLIQGFCEQCFESLVEPMLHIRAIPEARVDLAGCRAVLVTSANGIRAFAKGTDRRDLPVYAVGKASAKAALESGFWDVHAASGNVEALEDLVCKRVPPGPAPLFHAAGSVIAGDLKSRLAARGYAVRRVRLYEAERVHALSVQCVSAIQNGILAAASFYSPRTADTFVKLLTESGYRSAMAQVHALCLSEAVADVVQQIPWAEIHVAAAAETTEMIALAHQLERA